MLLLLVTSVSLAQGPQPSPTPPPKPVISFGVEVSAVQIDAIVTDKAGNVVRGSDPGRFRDPRGGQAAAGRCGGLRRSAHAPARASARGHRGARCADEREALRRPPVRDRARRPAHRRDSFDDGQARGAALHPAVSRRRRPRRRRLHVRPLRLAGPHRQPPAPAEFRGQVHGAAPALFDPQHHRRLPHEEEHRVDGRRRRIPRRPLAPTTPASPSTPSRESPTGFRTSAAVARRSSSSARGTTSTSCRTTWPAPPFSPARES